MTKLVSNIKDFGIRGDSHKWPVSRRANGRRGMINGPDSAQTTVTRAAPRQVVLPIYINDAYIRLNKCISESAADTGTG